MKHGKGTKDRDEISRGIESRMTDAIFLSPFFSRSVQGPGAAFVFQLKSKVGNIPVKATALRISLNIDNAPIDSDTHTHPSHSQTSRLISTSLSLGIPFLKKSR